MGQEQNNPVPVDEEFYRTLFDLSPFPTLVLGPDMVVLDANRKFLARYGLRREDAVGSTCHEVYHNCQFPCPQERCQFPEALKGEVKCMNLHEWVDEYGEKVVEEVHLTPLSNSEGNIWGVMESIRDVTQAKHLQSTLMEANEFLNRVLDSLMGVVVAADLEGNILFVNRSAQRVLGYDAHELVGEKLKILSDAGELKRINRKLEENQGQARMVNTYVRTKDGEKIPVRVNSSYVYREGAPVATVGIFTDLRERIKMEDQVVQARMQVVQSDKLAGLGRMAAGIAHELNNPLTGIMVYADLLKESLPPDDPAQEDLACILEDAERCQYIVKDMLEYSRQQEVKVENADLNHLVDDAFHLIRDNALFMHIKVQRQYHRDPLEVQVDVKLIRQVFINLFMNAVDAMEGRGILRVNTGLDEQGWRFVEVGDSGPGIAKENLDKVFDPFFTTKEVGKGTGLGLSVVYGVIDRHGGNITVKETGPQGTTFLVRLPPQAPAELADMAKAFRLDSETGM